MENTFKSARTCSKESANEEIAKKKIDEAQNNKRQIDDKYISVEKSLISKQNEYQQIELSLNTIKTVIQEQRIKFDEKEIAVNEYVKIDNWKQLFLSSSDGFINHIKEISSEWQGKLELLNNIEKQIDKAFTAFSKRVIDIKNTYLLLTLQ